MKKMYIIFSILLVLGVGSGIYYFTEYRESKMSFPEAVVMEDHNTEDYSFAEMEPKVRLLEFMYTNCPDICPNTTLKMKNLRDGLIKENVFGDKVEFLTVTFDPENDTQEALHHYAATFDIDGAAGWHLLRGSEDDTQKLADQFNFQYRDPGTGNFIHTNATYLLDADNRVMEVYGMGENNFNTDKIFKRIMKEVN